MQMGRHNLTCVKGEHRRRRGAESVYEPRSLDSRVDGFGGNPTDQDAWGKWLLGLKSYAPHLYVGGLEIAVNPALKSDAIVTHDLEITGVTSLML
jgi:hypothetical protein